MMLEGRQYCNNIKNYIFVADEIESNNVYTVVCSYKIIIHASFLSFEQITLSLYCLMIVSILIFFQI